LVGKELVYRKGEETLFQGLDSVTREVDVYERADAVDSPAHYQTGGLECIDVIDALTGPLRGKEAVYLGNVIKYLFRYPKKNGSEDLKKARWYLNRLIDEVDKREKKKKKKKKKKTKKS